MLFPVGNQWPKPKISLKIVPATAIEKINNYMYKHYKTLGQHPNNAGEIWKQRFISTVRPTVHINLSRKRSFFVNTLQTGGIWKRHVCVFVCTENILKTEHLEYDDVKIITWFPWPSFLKHKSKTTADCVFKFLRSSADRTLDSTTFLFRFAKQMS